MDPSEVRRLFSSEVACFACVFPRAASVKLHIVKKHFLTRPSARDFAWYDPTKHAIYLTRAALGLPKHNILGLIRHELGHAVDGDLDAPGAEARADRLAKQATGYPVRYDVFDVQSAYVGTPKRPDYLPK